MIVRQFEHSAITRGFFKAIWLRRNLGFEGKVDRLIKRLQAWGKKIFEKESKILIVMMPLPMRSPIMEEFFSLQTLLYGKKKR